MSDATIHDRSQLVEALAVACELEQGLCLSYLFTAFSLKDDVSEGLTLEELNYVRKWKANIFLVAAQEMLHLTQAANLLASVGGTVQLRRPNFPQSRRYYPTGLPWGLFPFSWDGIRLWALYERPAVIPDDVLRLLGGDQLTPEQEAALFAETPASWRSKRRWQELPTRYGRLRPRAVPMETIGELYEAIERAFATLEPPAGSVIIGSRNAQIDGRLVDFPQVYQVFTQVQAAAGIELIVQQGEGTRADPVDSHFGVFVGILREYQMLADKAKAEGRTFDPARDVHPNPLSRLHVDNTYPGWRLIDDSFTRAVNDLTSEIYEVMVLALYRFFATLDDDATQQRVLAWTFLRIMTTVVKPLGEALTRLPMGDQPSKRGKPRPTRAGPSFEINRSIQLMPHQASAWIFIHERLLELTAKTEALASSPQAHAPEHAVAIPYLHDAATTLRGIAEYFGARMPAQGGDR
ncbi:ferritin-like domain-containing protein [Paraliomyxa miuraensis]|uniref:ferritin-like domain-containing protein n=1 Tax=Paraliomyxa miuraensis TaxID=376150 RepID=UPI002253168F|nr:ferritin-like domain-containing protein [Paraliomyxa miuraensis]MCX4240388.1 ferritin-like protein [Paraliomyxa miuraensis]